MRWRGRVRAGEVRVPSTQETGERVSPSRCAAAAAAARLGTPSFIRMCSALPRLPPSTDLARLRRGRVATITVRAMSADAKLGPAGRALFKPQPTRSKR